MGLLHNPDKNLKVIILILIGFLTILKNIVEVVVVIFLILLMEMLKVI